MIHSPQRNEREVEIYEAYIKNRTILLAGATVSRMVRRKNVFLIYKEFGNAIYSSYKEVMRTSNSIILHPY